MISADNFASRSPPLSEVRELLDRGQVDGASITALLYLLAFAPIGTAMEPGETVPRPEQGSEGFASQAPARSGQQQELDWLVMTTPLPVR
jgi:hypothetical protein